MANLEVKDIFNEIMLENAISEKNDTLNRGFFAELKIDNKQSKKIEITEENAYFACHSQIFNN